MEVQSELRIWVWCVKISSSCCVTYYYDYDSYALISTTSTMCLSSSSGSACEFRTVFVVEPGAVSAVVVMNEYTPKIR